MIILFLCPKSILLTNQNCNGGYKHCITVCTKYVGHVGHEYTVHSKRYMYIVKFLLKR